MLASMVMDALAGFPRAADLGAEVTVKDHEERDAEQGHRPPDVDFDRGDGLGRKSHGAGGTLRRADVAVVDRRTSNVVGAVAIG